MIAEEEAQKKKRVASRSEYSKVTRARAAHSRTAKGSKGAQPKTKKRKDGDEEKGGRAAATRPTQSKGTQKRQPQPQPQQRATPAISPEEAQALREEAALDAALAIEEEKAAAAAAAAHEEGEDDGEDEGGLSSEESLGGGGHGTALDLAESGTTRILREGKEQLERYRDADPNYGNDDDDDGDAGDRGRDRRNARGGGRSHSSAAAHADGRVVAAPVVSAEERLMAEVAAGVERIAAGGSPGREGSPQSMASRLAALSRTHVTAIRNPDSRSPSPDVRRGLRDHEQPQQQPPQPQQPPQQQRQRQAEEEEDGMRNTSRLTGQPLPSGWKAKDSSRTGEEYYVNMRTMESTYDMPTEPARG
jgi:hypothetical protein